MPIVRSELVASDAKLIEHLKGQARGFELFSALNYRAQWDALDQKTKEQYEHRAIAAKAHVSLEPRSTQLTVTWTYGSKTQSLTVTKNRTYYRVLEKISDILSLPMIYLKLVDKSTNAPISLTDQAKDGTDLLVLTS